MKRLLAYWPLLATTSIMGLAAFAAPTPDDPAPKRPPPELYSNDPKKDSAPAISEYIREAKPLPAGTFYVHSTIDTGTGVGGGLIGTGAPDFARPEGSWKYGPVTVLIDARPNSNTDPVIKVRRARFRFLDAGIVGCRVWPDGGQQHITNKGDGPLIEITQQGAEWPVGQTDMDRFTLANSEIGILHSDDNGGGGHCDHTHARFTSHSVEYSVVVDDNQSVNHWFDIFVAGNCKAVIWAKQGGKIRGHITTNGHNDRLLLLGKEGESSATSAKGATSAGGATSAASATSAGPDKNNGYFNLTLSVDGGDRIGALVEEKHAYKWSRPIVHINGFAANDATLGEPILLNKAKVRINIERSLKPAYTFNAN